MAWRRGGVYHACLQVVWELYLNPVETRHRSSQVTIFPGRRCPGATFPTAFKCTIVAPRTECEPHVDS